MFRSLMCPDMLFVPGFVVSLLTFPGVVVHELAHEKLCNALGVPVFEVTYFRLGNPAGYVLHGEPARYRDAFAISVAPFLVNTVLALALFGAVATAWGRPDGMGLVTDELGVAGWVLLWLGFSVGMHAFPSTGDAGEIWRRSRAEWRTAPLTLLGLPFVLVIYVANVLSILWFDAIYAFGLLVAASLVVTAVPF